MQAKTLYLALVLALATGTAGAAPWTYRGTLNDGGEPANGRYDLRVSLLSESLKVSITSPITLHNVVVKNGQFAVDVDFGIDLASAPVMRLKTEVQQDGSGFVALGEPTRFDAKAALGSVCWDTSGNAGTNPNNDFVGTTDPTALVLRAHNTRALRIEPSAELRSGEPITFNVIAGSSLNSVSNGVRGSTISGGGYNLSDPDFSIASPQNAIRGSYGTIGGGLGNVAGNNTGTVIAGAGSTVAGGIENHATGEASTVGGGSSNGALGQFSTASGGLQNEAVGKFSMASGGGNNCAGGDYSWAGGSRAEVRPPDGTVSLVCSQVPRSGDSNGDQGSFLWAGQAPSPTTFRSTGPNQFGVRAASVFFGDLNATTVTIPAGHYITTTSGAHLTTGGTWTNASSRSLKTAFEAIDPMAVLGKVVSLPLSTWAYKKSVEGRHIGPVAEDFKALFGLGGDGKSISTVDADGVALAAIQGLNQKLEAENAVLKRALEVVEAQNQAFEIRLNALESGR